MKMRNRVLSLLIWAVANRLVGNVTVVNDDGAWNWLQDQRAVLVGEQLFVASVAMGHRDPTRAGDIDVTGFHLKSGKIGRFTLHHETAVERRQRWRDDHSCPALFVRPDGRLLALYALHGQEPNFYYRISRVPADVRAWSDEQVFATAPGSRVTFPSLVFLGDENEGRGRVFGFFRGLNNRGMPSLAHSDDSGETWSTNGVFVQLPTKVTPYVKYASDGRSTIHFAFTDGHRLDFNNGVYHAYIRAAQLWRSDGQRIGSLAKGITSLQEPTQIFRANPESVAMISDLEVDARGNPCVVYSVQMNTRPQRPRPVGADHRYRYARWNGTSWRDAEIAFAGTETHDAPDDDCTGLAAIDPQNVNIVYVSTNADPRSGAPLISQADGKRHWEIFKGTTMDDGANWRWTPLTRDSRADNLRPIVPASGAGFSPVVWLRGAMRMPKDSALEVVTLTPGTH